jgi:hypothetical protein
VALGVRAGAGALASGPGLVTAGALQAASASAKTV